MVQVALQRGGEDPRQAARRGGQIPATEEVSAAEDHLGRRGGGVLLQGAIEERVEAMLHEDQVPALRGEEEPGEGDRPDLDAGGQLVQESTAKGSHAADETVSQPFSFSQAFFSPGNSILLVREVAQRRKRALLSQLSCMDGTCVNGGSPSFPPSDKCFDMCTGSCVFPSFPRGWPLSER